MGIFLDADEYLGIVNTGMAIEAIRVCEIEELHGVGLQGWMSPEEHERRKIEQMQTSPWRS